MQMSYLFRVTEEVVAGGEPADTGSYVPVSNFIWVTVISWFIQHLNYNYLYFDS